MAKPRLLIVEDDLALTTLLKWHFEREEFDVDHTADGDEALRFLREFANRYPGSTHTPGVSEMVDELREKLARKKFEVAEQYNLDLLHVHYAIPHSISALLAQQMLAKQNIFAAETSAESGNRWRAHFAPDRTGRAA